ncbi:hypothetical protein F5B17DRAFT_436505 [Nemania serpens]|nr:hypothetical protein F5B17DRAFT_436505 [Nemania serpens]
MDSWSSASSERVQTPNTADCSSVEWPDESVSVNHDDQDEASSPKIPSQTQAHNTDTRALNHRFLIRPKVTVNVYNTGGPQTQGSRGSEASSGGPGVSGNSDAATTSGSHITGGNDLVSFLASRLEDLTKEVQRLSQQSAEQRPIIQSGTWNTSDVRSYKNPSAHTEGRVEFPRQFRLVPTVVISINTADVSKAGNFRVRTYATAVDTKGFVVHADSWADTVLYSCAVSWIAIGE